MRVFSIFFLLFISIITLTGQVSLAPYLGGVLRAENVLPGAEGGANLRFPLTDKGALILGLGGQYAEGNPNFDPDAPGAYNLEFGDYSPEFQAFSGSPFLYDFLVELPVKTATLVQYQLRAGYRRELSKGFAVTGGLCLAYVNKTYISEVVPNFDIEYVPFLSTVPQNFTIDYAVVVMLRYWDIAPGVTLDKTVLARNNFSLEVYSSANVARKGQHWFSLGLQATL